MDKCEKFNLVTCGEGCPDGHAVGEVVESVAHDDHPGDSGEVAGGGVDVAVAVRVTVVVAAVLPHYHLKQIQNSFSVGIDGKIES